MPDCPHESKKVERSTIFTEETHESGKDQKNRTRVNDGHDDQRWNNDENESEEEAAETRIVPAKTTQQKNGTGRAGCFFGGDDAGWGGRSKSVTHVPTWPLQQRPAPFTPPCEVHRVLYACLYCDVPNERNGVASSSSSRCQRWNPLLMSGVSGRR